MINNPFYGACRVPKSMADGDSILLITHELSGIWQLINLREGTIHTPQSYEAEYGFLPPCPPSANQRTRKEWYAHRKQNPADERGSSGRGFG